MITLYRTEVLDLPPTPLGLIGRSFRIIHTCTICRSEVVTDELIAHAKAHADTSTDHPDSLNP